MSRVSPKLLGKVVIGGEMKALTGLRIGAATSGLEIGGIDQPVLRDPVTERPYIPGSSLKGKLRSLLTKAYGLTLEPLVRQPPEVWIHWCSDESQYRTCVVCPTFGQFPSGPGQVRYTFVTPTRLIVRDAMLADTIDVTDEEGNVVKKHWRDLDTDLPYTEVKVEVALDVVTAASNPRQMERVPPGAVFQVELLFSVYEGNGLPGVDPAQEQERLRAVLQAMRLLEDDYLGSSGTRGYGKVQFQNLSVRWRPLAYYRDPAAHPEKELWKGEALDGALGAFDQAIVGGVWG